MSAYRLNRARVGMVELRDALFYDGRAVLLTGTCDLRTKPLTGESACTVSAAGRLWQFVGTVDAWRITRSFNGPSVAMVCVTGPATSPTIEEEQAFRGEAWRYPRHLPGFVALFEPTQLRFSIELFCMHPDALAMPEDLRSELVMAGLLDPKWRHPRPSP